MPMNLPQPTTVPVSVWRSLPVVRRAAKVKYTVLISSISLIHKALLTDRI